MTLDPVAHRRLQQRFTRFLALHRRPVTVSWAGLAVFCAALLAMQPSWQSVVVAGLLLTFGAAATTVVFATADDALPLITAAYGEGRLTDALTHLVAMAHDWRAGTTVQPAWA